MDDPKTDLKRAAILEQAFSAFTTYGYKRTTMDDIARAAGLSRPALYLVYRNKGDIFRALMQAMMAEMRTGVVRCFESDADIVSKVGEALHEAIVRPYQKIADTPHGAEIFDAKDEFASDLFLEWMAAVEEEIAGGLIAEEDKGNLDLAGANVTARRIASLLLDATEGMKMRINGMEEVPAKLADLVRLMIGPLTR